MINEVFQALGDPNRREILRLLREGPMTAGQISDSFQLAKSTTSGHLKVLRHAGLVVAEKTGTTIHYSLNMTVAQQAMAAVVGLLGSQNEENG